jgi:hypothetical protein
MTLHLPTHPAGYADHHILRNALIVIGAIALALVLLFAVVMLWPAATPSTTQLTESERMIEFRAGERAEFAAPVLTESERAIEFRESERNLP